MNKKTIIFLSTLILLGIIFALTHKASPKAELTSSNNEIILNNNDITKVMHGEFNNTIAFTGDLSPLNQTIVAAEVDATVREVKVAEGEFVQKNQVLAILDDSELKQAVSRERAILAAKKATFSLDQKKLTQQQELYKEGFISKIAYDELNTNYQGSLEAINQEKAALSQAEKQLSYATIKAPFAGYIYKKYIDNGQLANKSTKLFALANLDVMQIQAAIPSEQINQIHTGQSANFFVETSKQQYTARVSRINPVATLNTRSFLAYIDFDNRHTKLKSGQFAQGQIIINTLKNVDYISNDAIRNNSDGSSYVMALQQNIIVSIPVKVILTNSIINKSVIQGLHDGDLVINNSIINIKPNDKTKILN